MDSKITIDIDGDGAPRIRVDYKHGGEDGDDVRDKLIGRLLAPLFDWPGESKSAFVEIVLERGHEHQDGMVAFVRHKRPETIKAE